MRIATILLLSSLAAQAAGTYCVGPAATGDSSGIDWNNLKAWTSTPSRGDVWYLKGNVNYSGKAFVEGISGTNLITIKKATKTDHFTEAYWNDSYTNSAVFTGTIQFTTGYYIFDGGTGNGFSTMPPDTTPSHYGFSCGSSFSGYFLKLSGTTHITLRHIYGRAAAGDVAKCFIYSENGFSYLTVDHCLTDGWAQVLQDQGPGSDNLLWEYNICLGGYSGTSTGAGHGAGLDLSAWNYVECVNPIVRYSLFYNSVGTAAVEANNGNIANMDVYGCVFDGANSYRIIGNGSTDRYIYNSRCYNCTFLNSPINAEWFSASYGGSYGPGGNIGKNNLIYNQNAAYGAGTTYSYNSYFSAVNSPVGETGGQVTTGNPFINAAAYDYRLSADTSAGTALGATYSTDPLGATRTTWSRGAFQYAGAVVNTPPSITQQPVGYSGIVGSSTTLNVVAAGTAPLSYQWKKGGTSISGATLSAYSISNGTTNNNGSYLCTITNLYGSINSASVAVLFTNIPVLGTNFLATDGVLTGDWTVSGSSIYESIDHQSDTNGTGIAVYTFTNQYPGYYNIQVVYNAPTAAENSIWIDIDNNPVATDIWDMPVTTGFDTNLVSIRGNGTFDNNQFVPMTWQLLSVGQHRLIVIGREPNAQISSFSIVTNVPAIVAPSIVTQPQNQSITATSNATFSVVASGASPLAYQWRLNSSSISGATTSSYTTNNVSLAASGNSYSVVITNSGGSITSSVATLTVNPLVIPAYITTQPSSQSVTQGYSASFSVVAGGTTPLSYQWRKNGSGISGATLSSYTIAAVVSANAGSYSCIVTNIGGSVASANAVLTVVIPPSAPSISVQPANSTNFAGTTASFFVSATGTSPLSYQWRKNGSNIASTTTSSYSKSNVTNNDAGSYSVVITNIAGSITSLSATLTIIVPPTFLVQAQSTTNKVGANFSLASLVDPSTSPLPSYRWRKNGINLIDGDRISGSSTATLGFNNVLTNDAGNYSLVVTNIGGAITSSVAAVTIAWPPYIITQPTNNVTVCISSNLTLRVTAGGYGNLDYQWRKDGANLSDQKGYVLNKSAGVYDSGIYDVIITNIAGSVTSTTSSVTVQIPPSTPQLLKVLLIK